MTEGVENLVPTTAPAETGTTCSKCHAGGLLSHGPDLPEMFHHCGQYVARVLAGAKSADIPVEEATKFELVINLRTAKALGLTILQSLLQRADQVIE